MAVLFGCFASRLAAGIIFDLGLGDLFVVRTAGQVIDEAVLGFLEFGVDELSVPLIVVLGQDSCGVETAAVESFASGVMPAGFQRSLVERILPSLFAARRQGVEDIDGVVAEHTVQNCE